MPREMTPEERAADHARSASYRRRYPEHIADYGQQYRERHLEESRAYSRDYARQHREEMNAAKRRRYAKKKQEGEQP